MEKRDRIFQCVSMEKKNKSSSPTKSGDFRGEAGSPLKGIFKAAARHNCSSALDKMLPFVILLADRMPAHLRIKAISALGRFGSVPDYLKPMVRGVLLKGTREMYNYPDIKNVSLQSWNSLCKKESLPRWGYSALICLI